MDPQQPTYDVHQRDYQHTGTPQSPTTSETTEIVPRQQPLVMMWRVHL